MLQETANANLEVGSNLVRKGEISFWSESRDPDGKIDWDVIFSELQMWEGKGYIKILADPRSCKHKDNCFELLRPITAISSPPNSMNNVTSGSLRWTDLKNKKL